MSKVPLPTTPQVVLADVVRRLGSLEALFPLNPTPYDPQSAEEYADSNSESVSGAASLDLSLAHNAGSLLLDYTNPQQPTVDTEGVYAISADVISWDTAATKNAFSAYLVVTQAIYGVQRFVQTFESDSLTDNGIEMSVNWTGIFQPADSFNLTVSNQDSVARDFQCLFMAFTRILAL